MVHLGVQCFQYRYCPFSAVGWTVSFQSEENDAVRQVTAPSGS
jgi:hypothetical protein